MTGPLRIASTFPHRGKAQRPSRPAETVCSRSFPRCGKPLVGWSWRVSGCGHAAGTGPARTVGRGEAMHAMAMPRLTVRRHVDLGRVASAVCR
ncbi:putative leader peptide [Streptomyces citrinus]|uniref:putative leader peptide n=1 Tax=Streptomyces citrinus TaxID=3118173 RepID=UPI003CC5F1F5